MAGEPKPRALRLGCASVAVKDLVDSSSGRDQRYFKRLGGNDATCIIRHGLPSGRRDVFHNKERSR